MWPSGEHGGLVSWPGPHDPTELADGSLVLAATAPRPGVVVVRAIGEIDLLTAPCWRRMLSAATRVATASSSEAPEHRVDIPDIGGRPEPRPRPRLVCDLSPVTFLGASGLAVLVDLAEYARCCGDTDLRVVVAGGHVLRVLRLTGLDRRLTIEARLDQAVGGREDAYLALRTAQDLLRHQAPAGPSGPHPEPSTSAESAPITDHAIPPRSQGPER